MLSRTSALLNADVRPECTDPSRLPLAFSPLECCDSLQHLPAPAAVRPSSSALISQCVCVCARFLFLWLLWLPLMVLRHLNGYSKLPCTPPSLILGEGGSLWCRLSPRGWMKPCPARTSLLPQQFCTVELQASNGKLDLIVSLSLFAGLPSFSDEAGRQRRREERPINK